MKNKLLNKNASAETELFSLLKDSGATLLRAKKHYVFKLPNGKNFITAKTPSDEKARLNALNDLKGFLGPETMRRLRPQQYKNKVEKEPIPEPTPPPEGYITADGKFISNYLSRDEAVSDGLVRYIFSPEGSRLFLQFGPKAIETVKGVISGKTLDHNLLGLEFTANGKQTYRSFTDDNEALIFLNRLQKYKKAFVSKLLV